MSYLVLARKYRPQTFSEMIGQDHVVRTLTNAISQDRVAHAFLFSGARGVGKTSVARLLSKALNCEDGPTPEPCGKCPSCIETASGANVDVQEIDGASNNGVEQVRELRENARYLPVRDRHKIYIIDEVHMLSGAAFNALLKTLEEPPGHVKFMFATTEPHKIPVTILSRTQRFDLRRISVKKIVSKLSNILEDEGISMSPLSLALIARQAEGSMRDALSLMDQLISAGAEDDAAVEDILGVIDRGETAMLALKLIERDAAGALEIVERVFERGLDLARLAEDLAWHFRNLMVLQVGGRVEKALDITDHEREIIIKQSEAASPATLTFLFDCIHGVLPQVGRSSSPRMTLETALLKAIHMAPGVDMAFLIERVENLAGTLSGRRGGKNISSLERKEAWPGRKTPVSGLSINKSSLPVSREIKPESGKSGALGQKENMNQPEEEKDNSGGIYAEFAARMKSRCVEEEMRGEKKEEKKEEKGAEEKKGRIKEDALFSGKENEADPVGGTDCSQKKKDENTGDDAEGGGSSENSENKDPEKGISAGMENNSSAGLKKKEGLKPAAEVSVVNKKEEEPKKKEDPLKDQYRKDSRELSYGDDPDAPHGERYKKFVESVSRSGKKPFLVSALEHALPLSISDEEMVLALPRGLYYEGIQSSSNRSNLERLLEDHFEKSIMLRVEVLEGKKIEELSGTIAAIREKQLEAEKEDIRAEALNNPAVRLAVELMDGDIEDVRILETE